MSNSIQQKPNPDSAFISAQSYKGARDFFPQDMKIKNYIFYVWKKVCKRYGFEEYDFPIIEPFETFAKKSGEEIVNTQLYSFTDRGGRKVAVRPELTPGTVRMIAQRYKQLERPIKWFMIGNIWRYEKPQKGRGREFNQLEMNIFGVEGVEADFEIFSAAIDIMKEFGADEKMFGIRYSDRRLISALLSDYLKLDVKTQIKARQIMDKRNKLDSDGFFDMLNGVGLTRDLSDKIETFMKTKLDNLDQIIPSDILNKNKGYKAVMDLDKLLKDSGLEKFCEFDPSIIRGFDYSDGTVYEMFDKNPNNRRSMFGGERFDRLINIFGDFNLPATGFAMGDYTLKEFLTNWKLFPEFKNSIKVLVTLFDKDTFDYSYKIAQDLRKAGIDTQMFLDPVKLDKQLKYADKKGIPYVVIAGPDEIKSKTVVVKNMTAKEQKTLKVEELYRFKD